MEMSEKRKSERRILVYPTIGPNNAKILLELKPNSLSCRKYTHTHAQRQKAEVGGKHRAPFQPTR